MKVVRKIKRKKRKKKKSSDSSEMSVLEDNPLFDENENENDFLKKGKFSKTEDEILKQSLEDYLKEVHPEMEIDEAFDIFLNSTQRVQRGAWLKIAAPLPHRAVKAVVDHARIRFNPRNYKGTWTTEEQTKLFELVEKYGKKWSKIGSKLKRLPMACRDKYRKVNRSRKTGEWSKKEIKEFKKVLKKIFDGKLPEIGQKIPWERVQRSIKTRSITQFQRKLRQMIGKKNKENNWSEKDKIYLLLKIYKNHPEDESEVLFSNLSKTWPATIIYPKWKLLKKFVTDSETLSFKKLIGKLLQSFKLDEDKINNIFSKEEFQEW